MKILQVITSLRMGGAEHIVVELANGLVARGHQVDIAVFDGIETPFYKELEPSVRVYRMGSGTYNPLYIFKLVRLMRHYDLVHTHNSSPQLFTAIARVLCSVELVSTEHNTSNRKRGWKCYAPIESWMYGQYDHVVCISEIAEKKLREYMGGAWLDKHSKKYTRISTINNGVDVEAIHRAEPDHSLLEAKGDRKAVLMVAGFREAKDQDTIVRAMSLLDKECFEVWFAGIGTRMETVKTLAKQLGVADNVRFLGLRTDIPQVLQAADIVVMSSHWEGLSLSNIEGMSAGKPFVAADVNGLREVTKGYGVLFEHENDKELASTINRLAEDASYYQQIAGGCYERACQYDVSKMVEAYENVYLKTQLHV